jgi:formate hydrogenlyase subunit 4
VSKKHRRPTDATPLWAYAAVLAIAAVFALAVVLPALQQAIAALQNVIAVLP